MTALPSVGRLIIELVSSFIALLQGFLIRLQQVQTLMLSAPEGVGYTYHQDRLPVMPVLTFAVYTVHF